MEITVMSYNIERGFHSVDHKFELHRLRAAQRVVQSVNPDILALTEACYGGPNSHNTKTRYFYHFGFRYGVFVEYGNFGPRKGDEGGNFLLSRFPMQAEAISLAYKSAVRVQIPLEKRVLTIDVVHPSHSVTDGEKISTLRPLLETRTDPYILTGDFNTVSPEDSYNWSLVEHELRESVPDKVEFLLKNWQSAELISWLLGLGLKDAFPQEARQSTVPTMNDGKPSKSGVRMDFQFISPDIEVLDAYIPKTKDTDIASDHYPTVSVLRIN